MANNVGPWTDTQTRMSECRAKWDVLANCGKEEGTQGRLTFWGLTG